MRISSPWQGTLLILISAAGFGSNTILAKFAYAGGANVPTMLFLRFFAVSALLWLGMVVTGRSGFRLSGRPGGVSGPGGGDVRGTVADIFQRPPVHLRVPRGIVPAF